MSKYTGLTEKWGLKQTKVDQVWTEKKEISLVDEADKILISHEHLYLLQVIYFSRNFTSTSCVEINDKGTVKI